MHLYLNNRYVNNESMKKLVLIVLAGLFLGACAQKTCPTYTYNDLDNKEITVEKKYKKSTPYSVYFFTSFTVILSSLNITSLSTTFLNSLMFPLQG